MANWYTYNGVGNPSVPASYTRASVKPACTTGGEVCSIYLDSALFIPTTPFDNNTLSYISNGLSTLAPQPTTGKVFVYLRCGC